MKSEVVMDAVLFSYLNRSIFEVYLNSKDVGEGGSGHGIITGVTVPLGVQHLKWRDAGSGESHVTKNIIDLTLEQIPANANYIGIHIYPGDTFELTFSQYLPDPTERGQKIWDAEEKKIGK
jgi:hypothetical protein